MTDTHYRIARDNAPSLNDAALIRAARRNRDNASDNFAERRDLVRLGAVNSARCCFVHAMDAAKAAKVYLREYDRRHAVEIDLAAEIARAAAIVATPAPRCPGDTAPRRALFDHRNPDLYEFPAYDPEPEDDLFELPPPPPEIKLVF